MAAIALLIVAVTGTMLTWRYYPDSGLPAIDVPQSARWSRRLVLWHEGAMLTAVPVLVVWCGLTNRSRAQAA